MPTKHYTRYEFDADLQKFEPPVKTKLEFSKTWSCRNFNEYDRTAEIGNLTEQKLRKKWLFECRWLMWISQQSVWSNGLFLSLLLLSIGTTCSNWKENSTWNEKEGEGWNVKTVHRKENLNCCRNVGMWMLETLQDWCVSKRTLEKINPIQTSDASRPVIGQDKIGPFVGLRVVWYQNSRTCEWKSCQFPGGLQKNKRV